MVPILIAGALGGVLPTTARLASTYVSLPDTPLPGFGLLLGLSLFALIGAAIAYGTGSTEVRQALVAGVAAPGIITNLVAGADAPRRSDVLPFQHFALVSIAQAQPAASPPGPSASGSIKSITIDPRVSGGVPSTTNIPVTAQIAGGPNSETRTVQIGSIRSLTGPTTLTAPPGTQNITIGGKTVPLNSPDNKIDLSVSTRPSFGSDFLWALGGQRSFSIEQVVPKVDSGGSRP
ncbi:hypothetical protein PQJ75_19280 [Rhodoplanes sp. TEM]|uniref:Uncharacterized protein n=1 Tax=Rhodoplanes tepidamans TaxID=200616 RepID=A0ABT5JJ38_RHOTP|nr:MULTISPECIES: hypothetical protein [Rhodoplanes]MDC7789729.1 hypothetical protein [Rhodoplanes tepidamans]MDC7985878.1 hypothetical protein [Rhodoplanes sp. TEM]MDQ0354407.1 hypothetical protein [Rhodoplanes tepidamans]